MRKYFWILLLLTGAGRLWAAQLEDITLERQKKKSVITFTFDEEVAFEQQRTQKPASVTFTFPKQSVITKVKDLVPDNPVIQDVVLETSKGPKGKGPVVEKIVIHFKEEPRLKIRRSYNSILVELKEPAEKKEVAPEPETEVKTQVERKPQETPLSLPDGALTLDAAFEMAYQYYFPPRIKLSQDEMKLAKWKKWEAARALYPGIQARYQETDVDANPILNIGATQEKEYGLQMTQPIYQGGRLMATYKQARLNEEISKLQHQKNTAEMMHAVSSAYWNLVKAARNLDDHRDLLEQVEKDNTSAQKQLSLKAITANEALKVQSQYNQAQYQALSVEKDLALAKLNLATQLGIEAEQIKEIDKRLPFQEYKIELPFCVAEALAHKPDYLIEQKNLQVGRQARTIGRSSGRLKLDANGFYGRSGAAFENEELDLKKDWQISLRASQPFGGNTAAATYFEEETAPRLGQTTQTASKSQTYTFGLMDKINAFSDKKEGDIAYQRAQQKLIEAKQATIAETQESFFNLQKAMLQVQGSDQEIRLSEQRLRILKSKRDLNLASTSELVDARRDLTQAKQAYSDAVVFYRLSLSSLEKSIGQPGYWSNKR